MTSEATMLAYHNDPALKAAAIATMREHREHGRLVKGRYWEDGKGCAIGCMTGGRKHSSYPVKWGIPKRLAHLKEAIFERLPDDLSLAWPERFLDAIPVGVDLSLVWPRFAVWLLTDPEWGSRQFTNDEHGAQNAVDTVAALWHRVIDGENEKTLWPMFELASWAATREAGRAVRASWAARAAMSAAQAARPCWAEEAEAAAALAAAAWAPQASKEKWWTAASDKLTNLLRKESK